MIELSDIVTLCIAAFMAGAVDAIVGGGGLIQLPALLLMLPNVPVASLLGTNKLASLVGTSSAAITYSKEVEIHRGTAVRMAGAAFVGSGFGALVATKLSSGALRPIVLVALIVVLAYTIYKPDLGEAEKLRLKMSHQNAVALVGGALIGLYDGFIGPGTGSFLVFLLVGVVGLSFLHASATSKAVNAMTNLSALILFAIGGHVLWTLGLAMALANLAGSQIGARLAIKRGSKWVRLVFIVVVSVLMVRLAYDIIL